MALVQNAELGLKLTGSSLYMRMIKKKKEAKRKQITCKPQVERKRLREESKGHTSSVYTVV